MLKNDFSAKMCEDFITLIKEIKNLKELNKDTVSIIDASYKKFFGFGSGFVNKVSETDLKEMLKTNDHIDGNKCVIMASLLIEEANIYNQIDEPVEAFYRYSKSFNIFSEVFFSGTETQLNDYTNYMSLAADKLNEFEISNPQKEQIFNFYSISGEYAKAEDVLYDLIDSDPTYKNKAIFFYDDLLKKSDDALEKGNLPRNEVIDALDSLQKNQKS
ncbi:MAG: DUF6483 family protein [Bacillota bacterium]|nr:DUF6483 family protein [Bacillota bacterium]